METILVKNMVCHRCVLSVKDILKKEAIPFHSVLFGEIHLTNELKQEQKKNLSAKLKYEGFELIDSHMSELIEKIKLLVTKRARNEADKNDIKDNLSDYLSEKLHHEYTYLSSLFSDVEGQTIKNFFIGQRIGRAKELLLYEQMTLAEIAFELDYNNSANLSNQFKKTTGMTPSSFKEQEIAKRKVLE